MEASTTKKSPLIAPDSGAGHHHVVDDAEDTAHLLEFKETANEVGTGYCFMLLCDIVVADGCGHHHVFDDAADTAHLLEFKETSNEVRR
jgi:hypothetical protein